MPEYSYAVAWKTVRLWLMSAGRQKANIWHGSENVVAYGRLPSPARPTVVYFFIFLLLLSNKHSKYYDLKLYIFIIYIV